MKFLTIFLVICFTHLSLSRDNGIGLRKKLVKVVKRRKNGDNSERDARSIVVGEGAPTHQPFFGGRSSHSFANRDIDLDAKLREHERQRQLIFGRNRGSEGAVSQVGYTEERNIPRGESRAIPAQAHRERLSIQRRQRQGQRYDGNGGSGESHREALRAHSAALAKHKEELEAAQRLIKFHKDRYLQHRTSHIVPLPPNYQNSNFQRQKEAVPVYRPGPPSRVSRPASTRFTPQPPPRRVRPSHRGNVPRRPIPPTVTPRPVPQVFIQSTLAPTPAIPAFVQPQINVRGQANPSLQSRFDFPIQNVNRQISFPQEEESAFVDIGEVAQERCIDKVVYVEEIVEDEEIECHHSYSQKCHTTYVTDFKSESEEECEENFKKDCFIEYKAVAMNETVEFCHTPLIKDCNIQGPVECKTDYDTDCRTRYHEHQVIDDVPDCVTVKEYSCRDEVNGYKSEQKCKEWPVQRCTLKTELVTKATPETKCEKIPREICAPEGCGFVPGAEECFEKVETIVQDIPEETCNLQPQKHCKQVTKLVPNLIPTEECVDVPKEICSKSSKNPRKIKKPVTKKWCYTPTPESGLA